MKSFSKNLSTWSAGSATSMKLLIAPENPFTVLQSCVHHSPKCHPYINMSTGCLERRSEFYCHKFAEWCETNPLISLFFGVCPPVHKMSMIPCVIVLLCCSLYVCTGRLLTNTAEREKQRSTGPTEENREKWNRGRNTENIQAAVSSRTSKQLNYLITAQIWSTAQPVNN